MAQGAILGHATRMAPSSELTLAEVLDRAQALARRRTEKTRGVHLLAAMGADQGLVKDLLEEQGAGFRKVIIQWERTVDPGQPEHHQHFLRRLSVIVREAGAPEPLAPHVLIALLDDSHGSARVVLEHLGVSVAELRAQALAIVSALSGTRRKATPPARSRSGEVVPVMPKVPVRGPMLEKGRPAPLSARSFGAQRKEAGQALSLIPKVGPTPLPGVRLCAKPSPPDSEPSPGGEKKERVSPIVPGSGTQAEELEQKYGLDRKKYPILTTVGKNLTLAAALGHSDPVVGREDEIEEALDVLAKRQGNNPCLIGEAGVGKTSVARGIASALLETEDDSRVVIEIPIAEMVAGTGVRGALAGRLAALKKEVQAAGERVILFFDEMHQLFSGDAAEEIAGELKLSLSRGELPCIGATTTAEYRRAIESDAAISRRFTPIMIEEPGREEAFLVLMSLAERLEAHHRVAYDEEAIALGIAWSVRYLTGRCLPDKAASVLDLAGARCRRRGAHTVDAEAIAQVIAAQANMPVERLLESDGERMLGLQDTLAERVIGHEEHLQKMAHILRRNAAGLGGRRPIGTFLLLGPTGVGKTETAKAIAEVLFHSESAMTRIDMAEMSEAHSVAKLVGAPPGYVGHDAGGQLTEAVRRRPYQVVLLDEIEKAHAEVLTAFLAVFDEGRMTDSRGRLVDFTNTVIILTSNLGSGEVAVSSQKRVGFSTGEREASDLNARVVAAARKALPPELFNRIDEILPFSPLTRDDVLRIGRKLCEGLSDQIELSRGVELKVGMSALEVLLDEGGYDRELGARPLRRMIARRIEAPLAEAILAGKIGAGDTWHVYSEGGQLVSEVLPGQAKGAAE